MRHFLHRNVWQRVPQAWRRELLFRATKLAAPLPTVGARAAEPLIVVGPLSTNSGLGVSARLCHDALKAAGCSVFGIDLSAMTMQPVDHHEFIFADGREIAGDGTLILHVNAPFVPMAMARLGQRLVASKRIVGYWAWELPRAPADWADGARYVHEIWVPSRFVAAAVEPLAAGRPVHIIPHPVALGRTRAAMVRTPPQGPFTVLVVLNVASSFARKNPLGAVDAYSSAFGTDPGAQLIVKISNAGSAPEDVQELARRLAALPNARLIDASVTSAELDAIYRQANVLLSLHRSEGFGLVMAEAMLRGIPVVATDWSGNRDFVTPSTGLPVSYTLVSAKDDQGIYDHGDLEWAEPDIHSAAGALQRLRSDRELGAALAEQALNFAQHEWTAESHRERVRRALLI